MVKKYDFLVIGSGIAGMSFALKVASKGKVALLCKTEMIEANTNFAQGGAEDDSKIPEDCWLMSISNPPIFFTLASMIFTTNCRASFWFSTCWFTLEIFRVICSAAFVASRLEG